MGLRGCFLILIRCNFLTALSLLGGGHQRSVFAVRGEYTMKSCQVEFGFGNQGGQFDDEIHRLDKIVRNDFEQPKAGPKGEGRRAKGEGRRAGCMTGLALHPQKPVLETATF